MLENRKLCLKLENEIINLGPANMVRYKSAAEIQSQIVENTLQLSFAPQLMNYEAKYLALYAHLGRFANNKHSNTLKCSPNSHQETNTGQESDGSVEGPCG